jgi:hypothetical protein
VPAFADAPGQYLLKVGENALVGCAQSALSGGSCGSGAASAAVSAGLAPILPGDLIGGTIARATVGGLASVAGGGKFANGAVTGAFQYLATASLEAARRDPRMDALAMGPEDALPGVGPFIAAGEAVGMVASARPAGDANDNGFPPMPDFNGGKTTGYLVTADRVLEFVSGWGGPATNMPQGASGYDIVTRTHVEGNAAAYMQQQGISSASLYINNPQICDSCTRLLPRMLAPNSTLTVWLPGGTRQTFVGISR